MIPQKAGLIAPHHRSVDTISAFGKVKTFPYSGRSMLQKAKFTGIKKSERIFLQSLISDSSF